jgi:hypothetical protein
MKVVWLRKQHEAYWALQDAAWRLQSHAVNLKSYLRRVDAQALSAFCFRLFRQMPDLGRFRHFFDQPPYREKASEHYKDYQQYYQQSFYDRMPPPPLFYP